MKQNRGLLFGLCSMLLLASCAESQVKDYEVDLPEGYDSSLDYLAGYGTLKSYVPASFKMGATVDYATYTESSSQKKVLINSNVTEVAPNNINHASMVDADGVIDANSLKSFVASADIVSVYGPSLIGAKNQNDLYVEGLVASYFENVDENNPTKDVTSSEMIEGGDLSDASSFAVDGSASIQAFDAKGDGGEFLYSAVGGKDGGCISLNNEGANQAQIVAKISGDPIRKITNSSSNDKYIYSFDVKADKAFSMGKIALLSSDETPKMKIMAIKEGSKVVAGNWTHVVAELNIAVDDEIDYGAGFNRVLTNLLGGVNATQMLFDNISLKRVSTLPNGTEVIYTEEQKKTMISESMTNYITEVVSECPSINSWSVVDSPLSDNVWAKYIGDDYAVKAIEAVRAANSKALIFVEETDLEDSAICNKFIATIEGWNIDGITVNINPECNNSESVRDANIEEIKTMLKSLAATGKMIRLAGMDVKFILAGTEFAPMNKEEEDQISAFYTSVLKAYFENVPESQQYGISKLTLIDQGANADGMNIYYGLWSTSESGDIARKHAYKGFVEGLNYSR